MSQDWAEKKKGKVRKEVSAPGTEVESRGRIEDELDETTVTV